MRGFDTRRLHRSLRAAIDRRGLASYAAAVSEDFARNAYREFRGYPAWGVVDRAVNDLIENGDLEETTVHELIVGYIVKSLAEANLVASDRDAVRRYRPHH